MLSQPYVFLLAFLLKQTIKNTVSLIIHRPPRNHCCCLSGIDSTDVDAVAVEGGVARSPCSFFHPIKGLENGTALSPVRECTFHTTKFTRKVEKDAELNGSPVTQGSASGAFITL